MKIKLIRSKPRKAQSGIQYDEDHDILVVNKTFNKRKEERECTTDICHKPEKVHVTTIPLKKYIHPCLKDKIPCYDGDYYKVKKGSEINVECEEC